MGEEEALLRSLHFLELMTSLRAAGTVPLTLSGSSRAHHSPAGMQRGGADGKGAAGGVGGGQEVETRGNLPVFAGTRCCSLFFPLFLLFSLWHLLQGGGGTYHTKFNHSFTHQTLSYSTTGETEMYFIHLFNFKNNFSVKDSKMPSALYQERDAFLLLFIYSFYKYLPAPP